MSWGREAAGGGAGRGGRGQVQDAGSNTCLLTVMEEQNKQGEGNARDAWIPGNEAAGAQV